MAGEALLFVVFLLIAVASPFVLYTFVRDETRNNPRMSREDAERMVRRDTHNDGGGSGGGTAGGRTASGGTAGGDARDGENARDSRNDHW